jgi:hypothetical protein
MAVCARCRLVLGVADTGSELVIVVAGSRGRLWPPTWSTRSSCGRWWRRFI